MRRIRRLISQEERRRRLAEMLAARPALTVREAARALGCSIGTAHADLTAVRADWAERRRALIDQAVAEDLARTDEAIAAIWPAVLAGQLTAIDRLVRLLHYRARVLGLLPAQPQEPDLWSVLGQALARELVRLASAARPPNGAC
jgi:hypothetical protein